MTTTSSAAPFRKLRGTLGTALRGMVTTTTSAPAAASAAKTAVAPVSAARSANVSGFRELATETWWPSAVSLRVRLPPILPAPMIPMFISIPPARLDQYAKWSTASGCAIAIALLTTINLLIGFPTVSLANRATTYRHNGQRHYPLATRLLTRTRGPGVTPAGHRGPT